MEISRCLYCYQALGDQEIDFHPPCSKKFFGTELPPELGFTSDEMEELARQIISQRIAVTGVQPKLSLEIEKVPKDPKRTRLTIVGLWGNYILKPPTQAFKSLPENEDLTMHLAAAFDLPAAEHSLIRLKSGELAYITKRFDRTRKEKLAMEDACQFTETLTANKYRSSMEKVGRSIQNFSTQPGLEAIRFFELALFCFITGNADMHLKNFSLLTTATNDVILAPGYDLLCTKIALPEDQDEMALTINGKKSRITRTDFDALAKNLGIPDKALNNIYSRFADGFYRTDEWIQSSFLPDPMKPDYKGILATRARILRLT